MATMLVFLLLLAGKSVCMNLNHSPEATSWDEALQYCQDKNGGLIDLDSEDKWNNLTSHDVYQQFKISTGSYWTSLRFNESVPCSSTSSFTRRWLYEGWGRWKDVNKEPNGCPSQKCVKVIGGYMRTTQCSEKHTALCETEFSPSTKNQTSDSIVTSLPQFSTKQTEPIAPTPTLTSPESVAHTSNTDDGKSRQNVHQSSIASVFDTTSPTGSQEHQLSTHFQSHDVSSVNPLTTTDLDDVATQTIISTTKLPITNKTLIDSRTEKRTCGKCCTRTNKTLSDSDMAMKLTLLKIQLAVNKTNLSFTKRKRISVYDARLSTSVIGGVACVVLVTIVGIVIIPDCIALLTFLYK